MGIEVLGKRGIIGRFYNRLETLTAQSWASRVAMLTLTDQESEEYKWLGMTPGLREWVGGRDAKGLRAEGVVIRNKLFEGTIGLSVDDIRRDKTGQVRIRVDELSGRAAEHPDELLSQLIQTPGNAYDGKAFFAADHEEGESGSQRNTFAAAQISALDVADANNPTAAEMSKIIPLSIQSMLGLKDDQGKPMNHSANEFLFMVPVNMMAATEAAMNLPLINDGNGSLNNLVVNMGNFKISYVTNPRLTNPNKFYMFRTDATAKPFIQQEETFEVGFEDQGFLNRRVLFGVAALRNVGTGFWQYASEYTLS